ncbi:MAG: alpha/beta hydrolase [Deltaproteobacteria bacterium]|nr:alpha/beta hydrolase [Deltaproteobacteria bacterium]
MITYRKVKGLKIACFIGNGMIDDGKKSLIFIAGSGQDHTAWINQLTALGKDFNVVGLDLPGHGASEGKGEQSVDAYVEWVKSVIESLAIRKPVLIGHSLGGAICLAFALKYGESLSGIVPLGSGVRMPVNPMIFDLLKNDPDALAAMTWKWSVAKTNRERLAPYFAARQSKSNPDVTYGDFLACDQFDISETVSQIAVPTLIICGAEDKMTPPSLTEFLKERIAGSQIQVIPHTGHLVMIEDVDAFNGTLKSFVNSLF